MKTAVRLIAVLTALVLVSAATSATLAGPTRVSVSSTNEEGDRPSFAGSISASGRFVAFTSQATNLVPDDTNERQDAFVYDRRTGSTERVSVTSSGAQARPGEDSFGGSAALGMSADGRYVLFRSDAPNLAASKSEADAFIRDRTATRTRRIPVLGLQVIAGAMSQDGRYAVVEAGGNVYRYSLHSRHVTRLTAKANSWSADPAVSADGRYVAFTSNASNLVPGDTNKLPDVFVRDVQTGKTTRVSVTSAGKQGVGKLDSNGSNAPVLSPDGRYVAFHSDMTNLVPGDTNKVFDIFVHDRVTGKTQRVSVSSSGQQADQESLSGASFSADDRFLAFTSLATNLVANDHNEITDVFIRDLRAGNTRLASLGVNGQGDDASFVGGGSSAFTRNSRYLLFASWAGNLVPGDTNGVADVFVRDLRQ